MSDESNPAPRTGRLVRHWHSPDAEPPTIVDGHGVSVVDAEGREYLDFLSQLYCVNAGHDNDAIASAITDQLKRIPFVSSAKDNDTRQEFADRLVDIAPSSLSHVFFSITGSEANEAAAQFAREVTGGQTILTRWRSYHGASYGAASLTGDPETRAAVERYAATTGAGKFLPPMTYRSPFAGETPEEIAEQAANHLEFVIRNEGPDAVAGIMMEPIAGTSGAYTAPPGYFERIRELCDEYDILLIADEVITGFGRCGDWFGIQTEDVEPDMITFAKGATSAYVPLGGVLASPTIGEQLEIDGIEVGQTFAGHPLACAAGNAALDEYGDGLIENVRSLEETFARELRALKSEHDIVGDIRGRGFLWSVEFTDPETGEPVMDPRVDEGENPVKKVREIAESKGVLFGAGRPDIQIIIAPPLCASAAEIERAVEVLDESILEAT